METLLIFDLIVVLAISVGLFCYCIYSFIKNKNEEEIDPQNDIVEKLREHHNKFYALSSKLNELKREIKQISKNNKELQEDLSFQNNHSLNLYAEQNDCWAEIERLSNEIETLRKHINDTDKINNGKFTAIANRLNGGKND